jgi:hypothetical protein
MPSVVNPNISPRPGFSFIHQFASIGETLFCVPRNPKIDDYWNTLEDRLFKIRHSQNIDGVQRILPLFEPPIDPALLVQAAAAGLDIGSVISDIHAPSPRHRFSFALQKAVEFCNEHKAFGAALLSAHEKSDAEELARLRSTQEITMLELTGQVKQRQLDEAKASEQALRQSRASAELRYQYYQRLMAKQDIQVPPEQTFAPLDASRLQIMGAAAVDTDVRGYGLSVEEVNQMASLESANNLAQIGSGFQLAASVAHVLLPDMTLGYSWPSWSISTSFGGTNVGNSLSAVGQFFSLLASQDNFTASRSGIVGGHQRRYDDWMLQSNLAVREMEQIDKQLLAAAIRTDIALRELSNHQTQLANSREVDRFMREKFSNQELYQWMTSRLAEAYFAVYQLAYDFAKRAERAAVYELGPELGGIVRFGDWDDLRSGLLAGERLSLDLKRLEAAYMDRNNRENELTLPVSVSELDPVALLTLQATGACEFTLPENLYDSYLPGHYYRRIKTVSVSLPCVIGPHTSVSGTLTMLSNSMRVSASGSADLVTDLAPIQSIATSSATNDPGLFELNFRDERYLPFEGAGAASRWRFELPTEFRRFDYWTITDLVLHMKYTARDGGAAFKAERAAAVRVAWETDLTNASNDETLARAFSLRRDFAVDWARLLASPESGTLTIDQKRFPFMLSREQIIVWKVGVLVVHASAASTGGSWITLSAPSGAYYGKDNTLPALPLLAGRTFDDAAWYEYTFAPGSEDGGPFLLDDTSGTTDWTIKLSDPSAKYRDVVLVLWWKLGQRQA